MVPLLLFGLAGVIIWALSQGGSETFVREIPEQVLFEGRYWSPNELRAELRRRFAQTPDVQHSIAYTYVALENERLENPSPDAEESQALARLESQYLQAIIRGGLEAKTTEDLDALLGTMREIGMTNEASYRAIAYYVAKRNPLIDPWAQTAASSTPEELHQTANAIEPAAPEAAETLRDIADARTEAQQAVSATPQAPARPLEQQGTALPADAPLPGMDYVHMDQTLLAERAGAGDENAWREIERRFAQATTEQLVRAIAGVTGQLGQLQGVSNPATVAFVTRMRDEMQAELDRRTSGAAAPTAEPAPTPTPMYPAGYDSALSRALAPRVADAIRRVPYTATTVALVRRFQTAAALVSDGKYGGRVKGALRFYGVSNPPPALYRPTAEVTYSPPTPTAAAA